MLSIGTNADHLKKFIYVTVALFLICLFLIWAAAGFANSSDMVGHIPLAVSGTLLAILGIIKWGWKLGPFPWILGIPVLEGTWTGHLESDWEHGRSNIQQTDSHRFFDPPGLAVADDTQFHAGSSWRLLFRPTSLQRRGQTAQAGVHVFFKGSISRR
jgi:hypothetical protein